MQIEALKTRKSIDTKGKKKNIVRAQQQELLGMWVNIRMGEMELLMKQGLKKGRFIQFLRLKLYTWPGRYHLKDCRATTEEGILAGVLLSLKMGVLEPAFEVWQ